MYDNKIHQYDDRIVNLYQPHVRPIVRGKEKSKVEFGAKLNLSLVEGFARIDNLNWYAFNEGIDLKDQVEAYKIIIGLLSLISSGKQDLFFKRKQKLS